MNVTLTQTETVKNTADAFRLSQIDFSKIESRPTSALLLQYLRFQQSASTSVGINGSAERELPRFQYCFYLVGFVSTNAKMVVYGPKPSSEYLSSRYPCVFYLYTFKVIHD